MRAYRAHLSPRSLCLSPRCNHLQRAPPAAQAARLHTSEAAQQRSILPSVKDIRDSSARWRQYESSDSLPQTQKYSNPLNYVQQERLASNARRQSNRRWMLYGGALTALLAVQLVALMLGDDDSATLKNGKMDGGAAERLDAPPGKDAGEFLGKKVVEKPGTIGEMVDEDGRELVPTGTTTHPFFPKSITLESQEEGGAKEEYQLLGLGIRSVSFLSIQVYVLGFYVRAADMPTLQAAFVKKQNPLGTSLIPQEKAQLKADLLDPDKGLEMWDDVLREARIKSAVRIVPVRNTDFGHLRDGFVRGVTAKTQDAARKGSKEYDDEKFGAEMQEFKKLFGGRGKAPIGSVMTLVRDREGALAVLYQKDEKKKNNNSGTEVEVMGSIRDERIARQVWLGYLGGKTVSSEPARKSIVDGVLDLVERPVGTVGMQVT